MHYLVLQFYPSKLTFTHFVVIPITLSLDSYFSAILKFLTKNRSHMLMIIWISDFDLCNSLILNSYLYRYFLLTRKILSFLLTYPSRLTAFQFPLFFEKAQNIALLLRSLDSSIKFINYFRSFSVCHTKI